MQTRTKLGFTYTIEQICPKTGIVLAREVKHNIIPVEGLNYIINSAFRNQAAFANFYVGLYSGSYTPDPDDTAATFPGSATEITEYTETTRRLLVLGAPSNGSTDNSASRAEFTGTTNGVQAAGGFISSAPTKSATTGVLVSAVRFSSPRPLDSGGILRVTAGLGFISV